MGAFLCSLSCKNGIKSRKVSLCYAVKFQQLLLFSYREDLYKMSLFIMSENVIFENILTF